MSKINTHGSTPAPLFLTLRDETQPWSKQNSDQNSDHARLCIYRGKEKLRPWSKFLGRENSDHGLNFGLPRGGGRSCLDEKRSEIATTSVSLPEALYDFCREILRAFFGGSLCVIFWSEPQNKGSKTSGRSQIISRKTLRDTQNIIIVSTSFCRSAALKTPQESFKALFGR